MTGNGRNQPPTTKRAPEPGPARLARPGPGGLPVVSDGGGSGGRRPDRAGCRQKAGHSRDAEEARQD